jgi:hypothetical protein
MALWDVLSAVCGLGAIVCWIIVLIKIFQESILLGILGLLCGLFAFVYGWVKVGEYGTQKVMLIWTVLVVAGIPLYHLSGGAALPGG